MAQFYNNEDMLFGKRLLIWAQKFNRNKKQNFIKILGSAGCEIAKQVTDQNEINLLTKSNSSYRLHGSIGDLFNKMPHIICEPECNSNCPDYTGTKGHIHKRDGHTPATKYKVEPSRECVCAIAYPDPDRQKRKTYIMFNEIELINKP